MDGRWTDGLTTYGKLTIDPEFDEELHGDIRFGSFRRPGVVYAYYCLNQAWRAARRPYFRYVSYVSRVRQCCKRVA